MKDGSLLRGQTELIEQAARLSTAWLSDSRSDAPALPPLNVAGSGSVNSGCWLWLASNLKDRYGADSYGIFGWEGSKTILAHRAAWLLYRGELPVGLDLRHRCDNRLCVNPDHLLPGTRTENMRDAMERGRICRGETRRQITVDLWEAKRSVWLSARPRGENHANSKLTRDQVVAIRASTEPSSSLAAAHGVTAGTIRRVRAGKGWQP